MVIEINSDVNGFFRQIVESACKNQKIEITNETKTYLVMLLSDFVRPETNKALNETLDRSLTLILDEALHTPVSERFDKLKSIGDGILYISGFFGDNFESRGVDDDFIASIGGFAYHTASSMLCGKNRSSTFGDVYSELSRKFSEFVNLIAEVADMTSFNAKTNRSALRLYEKWLRTGNERIARELVSFGVIQNGSKLVS